MLRSRLTAWIGMLICAGIIATTAAACGGTSHAPAKHAAAGDSHAATGATVTSPAAAQAAAGGLDGIRAAGDRLVNDRGKVIHLHGVDTEGTEYQCVHGGGIFDTSPSSKNAADMAAWHANFTRIGLNALCVDCAAGVPKNVCGTRYMAPIEQWVQQLNHDGMYVEVMLMWDIPCDPSNCTGVVPYDSYQDAGGPTEDHAPQAWATMANDFKNDPNVMLGLWGEDYDSFPCKLHGGATCNSIAAQVQATTLAAGISSGSPSTIQVSGLADDLITGETIWLTPKQTLKVTSHVDAGSGSVTIPVSGNVSASHAAGAKLYYANLDPGDHTGVTAKLTGANAGITWDARTAGAQQGVNIIRRAGFKGPIVYTCAVAANVCSNPDTPGGKGDYNGGTWLTDMPSDPDKEIVAATDFYGPSTATGHQDCSGNTCWNNTVSPIIKAGHPFIVNEYGSSPDATECGASYTTGPKGLLHWMDSHGASGYSAWSWFDNSHSCLDLVASYTSTRPDPKGAYAAGVKAYYQRHFPPDS